MESRVLPFRGIHNFRDYGGYAAADGARVKPGQLFRSGQHIDATDDDLSNVASLNLSVVIDLRGNSERADAPCPRPAGFGAQVVFADGETADRVIAPHLDATLPVSTADDAHQAMVRLYQTMPFRPYLVQVFGGYFDALAKDEGPTLVHCLAGKDRTGVIVALLHDLLGVHQDDLMADYLLTNVAGNPEARIAAAAATVRAHFGAAMDDAAVRTLMSVHPEYLHAAFRAIDTEHGGLAAYRRDVLGVSREQEAAIRTHLLG